MAEALDAIEPWIGGLLSKLSAGERRKLSRKVGQDLRKINAARIRANVTPDGGAMVPRKPRPRRLQDRKAGRVKAKGRMFRKIGKASNLRVEARSDSVALTFVANVQRTAQVHHDGMRVRIGRFRNAPFADYPARPLLGFGPDDPDIIMASVLKHLE